MSHGLSSVPMSPTVTPGGAVCLGRGEAVSGDPELKPRPSHSGQEMPPHPPLPLNKAMLLLQVQKSSSTYFMVMVLKNQE